MRRPQFSLKTLLWLMAVVAALFAGIDLGKRWERQGAAAKADEAARLAAEDTALAKKEEERLRQEILSAMNEMMQSELRNDKPPDK